MKQLKVLSAVGLLALAGAAQADTTSSVAIVSDYDFRGYSQTGEAPALQVSIDFATGGWYVGAWGSNVDGFSDGGIDTASTEVDVYTGYKFSFGDAALDTGLVYYTYAGASDLNFAELYGKFSYKIVSAGLYYSNDFGGKYTGDNGDSALYLSADLAIPAGPLTIGVHAGYSNGDGVEAALLPAVFDDTVTPAVQLETAQDSYLDYGLGVTYAASNFSVGMKWVGRDTGDHRSDDRIILSVSTALPWGE